MANCNCGNSGGCGMLGDGCPINLNSMCVYYQGNVPLSNINAIRGERLETILRNIDERLGKLGDQVLEGFIGENVGGGVEIYKGLRNGSNVGELRTLVSSESIYVDNTADTISFSIKDSWINNIVDSVNTDVTNLINDIDLINKKLKSYDAQILQLQVKDSEQDKEIKDLKDKVTGMVTDVTDLKNSVSTLNNTTSIHTKDIEDLKLLVNNLNRRVDVLESAIGNVSVTTNEVFTGQTVCLLAQEYRSVIGVFYNGIKLVEGDTYVVQSPNQVILQLTSVGLTVDPTDKIQVMYNVKP